MSSPIIISGVPRSGGGIIAQILDKVGVYSGGIDKSNSFENTHLQRSVIYPFFTSINADVRGQYPLPTNYSIDTEWRYKIEEALDIPINGNWFIKDSKALLIWKQWYAAYPDAKWIIVRRRTGDIINSCLHTSYMDAFNNESVRASINVETISQGWRWWVHQYEERILEMVDSKHIGIIYPERILNGDLVQLYETLYWANVPITKELDIYVKTFKK